MDAAPKKEKGWNPSLPVASIPSFSRYTSAWSALPGRQNSASYYTSGLSLKSYPFTCVTGPSRVSGSKTMISLLGLMLWSPKLAPVPALLLLKLPHFVGSPAVYSIFTLNPPASRFRGRRISKSPFMNRGPGVTFSGTVEYHELSTPRHCCLPWTCPRKRSSWSERSDYMLRYTTPSRETTLGAGAEELRVRHVE